MGQLRRILGTLFLLPENHAQKSKQQKRVSTKPFMRRVWCWSYLTAEELHLFLGRPIFRMSAWAARIGSPMILPYFIKRFGKEYHIFARKGYMNCVKNCLELLSLRNPCLD